MRKVLIVDDDDIVVFLQRKMLERCGISIDPLAFKSGLKALEFFTSEKPGSEYLMLLDINMPRMSGWELLNKLKDLEIYSKIQVIMVTSSIDIFDKKMADNYDRVIGFIEKPVSVEDCEALKKHPGIERFFKDNIS